MLTWWIHCAIPDFALKLVNIVYILCTSPLRCEFIFEPSGIGHLQIQRQLELRHRVVFICCCATQCHVVGIWHQIVCFWGAILLVISSFLRCLWNLVLCQQQIKNTQVWQQDRTNVKLWLKLFWEYQEILCVLRLSWLGILSTNRNGWDVWTGAKRPEKNGVFWGIILSFLTVPRF